MMNGETVISDCFSYQDILTISSRACSTFEIIEQTTANIKLRDRDFSLFWDLIYDKVKDHLPSENFTVKGGYMNSTEKPYVIHTDGARNSSEQMLCNLLIPIEIKFFDRSKYKEEEHRFYIMEQQTDLATTFRMGRTQSTKQPYSRLAVTKDDYQNLMAGCTNQEFDDKSVLSNCDHLSSDEFYGMTLRNSLQWRIKDCIIFHPHSLHVSSNFIKLGIRSSTNLTYSFYK